MLTFKIYTNAALTVEFTGNLVATQNVDGSTGRQDSQVWLGSTAAGKVLQADSDPGVDQITVGIVDAAPGSGHPASDVTLALTQGGLDTAVPGDPLDLGVEIQSGVGNAVSFWIGIEDSTGVIGTSTELQVTSVTLREAAA